MAERVPEAPSELAVAGPAAPEATTAEVRAWARSAGLDVPDRGRLRPEVWAAYRDAQAAGGRPVSGAQGLTAPGRPPRVLHPRVRAGDPSSRRRRRADRRA